MGDEQTIESRIEQLETKINVIMSLVSHINETMSNNVIQNIQDVIDEAVDKKINYIKQTQTETASNDDGAKKE
jgi:Zn-dependent oligopeptidase